MRKGSTDIEAYAIYQADDVESRVEYLGEIEEDADGAAELGTQGAGDEIVGAAALDLAIGGDGGEGQCGEKVDKVGR